IVYDVIYNPLKTRFLSEAEKKGSKIINGLGMLFYQGVTAYEIWTGIKLTNDFLKDLYESYLLILKKD
ncbi:MAG: shikimate dehydrogenase, partial [Clostridiales bacterium]|nr:shikimate dehydrogenase [Clostridiales bacterium]